MRLGGYTEENVLCNDGTESSPPHIDVGIRLTTDLRNLGPNILSFPITVRPYHKHLRAASLRLEVICNCLGLFLDLAFDGCVKQNKRVARGPLRVHVVEVIVHDMTRNRRDCKEGVALRIAEVIVLDVLVATIPLRNAEQTGKTDVEAVTYRCELTSGQNLGDRLRNRRFLGDTKYPHKSPKVQASQKARVDSVDAWSDWSPSSTKQDTALNVGRITGPEQLSKRGG